MFPRAFWLKESGKEEGLTIMNADTSFGQPAATGVLGATGGLGASGRFSGATGALGAIGGSNLSLKPSESKVGGAGSSAGPNLFGLGVET